MLKVENLNFKYGSQTILKDINFELNYGQCMAILGNNGAGKSTMIKCINNILHCSTGSVFLDEQNLHQISRKKMAQKMAYVAQVNEFSSFSVFDTVLLGRKPYMKFGPTTEDYQIVHEVIEKVGLSEMSLAYTNELSGGELQKVMFARALAQKPKVLLLDEPTSNLDLKNQHDVLEMVQQITKQENICVLMVIHDLNLALRYCDQFLLLKDKAVYAYGNQEIMTAEAITHVYGMPVMIEEIIGVKTVVPITEKLKYI